MKSCGLKTIKIGKQDVPFSKVIAALDATQNVKNLNQAIVEGHRFLPDSVDARAWETWFKNIHDVSSGRPITESDIVGYEGADERVFKLRNLLNMEDYIETVKGGRHYRLLPETVNIINATKKRLIRDNTYLTDNQIDALIDSVESALFVDKAIKKSTELRTKAKKNISRKLGTHPSYSTFRKLVDTDMRLVQPEHREMYIEVLAVLAQHSKVLNIDPDGVLLDKTKIVLAGLNQPKLYEGIDLDNPEDKKFRISQIIRTGIDGSALSLPQEKQFVKELKGLLTEENLSQLDNMQLQHLIEGLQNIQQGFLPHVVYDIATDIKANKVRDIIIPVLNGIEKISLTNAAQRFYGKVKSSALKGNTNEIAEIIRSSPFSVVDEVFGSKKTEIFNNIFRPLGIAQEKFSTQSTAIQASADKVNTNWVRKFKGNDLTRSQYKIKLLEKQKEFEANPGLFSANSYVGRIINDVNKRKTTFYSKADVEILESLQDEFFKNGKFDIAAMEASLTPEEKAVVDFNIELNKQMTPIVTFTSGVIRGERVDTLNEYSHSNILDADGQEMDLKTLQERFKGSAKSGTLNERANLDNAPLIALDPLGDSVKAAKMTLMDYHLTPAIRLTNRATTRALDAIGEASPDSLQATGAQALKLAVDEAVETQISVAAEQYSFTTEVWKELVKNSYAVQLASVPRAFAELLSNVGMAVFTAPTATIRAISDRNSLAYDTETAIYVMERGGSVQMSKLYDGGSYSGKYVEQSHFDNVKRQKARASDQVTDRLNRVAQTVSSSRFAGKVRGVMDASIDGLLSGPDKLVTRPVYWGTFEQVFEQQTGQKFDKSKSKDEAYWDKHADDIAFALAEADKISITIGASNNPFVAIAKLKRKPGDTHRNAYRLLSGYLMKFLIFEGSTFRSGFLSAIGKGRYTKAQGAAILLGATLRMSLYFPLLTLFSAAMAGALGIESDEEEQPIDEMFRNEVIGSLVTIISQGRLSAFPRVPINMAIEEVNQEHLGFLRGDKEYDPYKHSLVFNLISDQDFRYGRSFSDMLTKFAGPYRPLIRDFGKLHKELAIIKTAKDEGRIDAAQEAFLLRALLMSLGYTGNLPVYRDILHLYNTHIWNNK